MHARREDVGNGRCISWPSYILWWSDAIPLPTMLPGSQQHPFSGEDFGRFLGSVGTLAPNPLKWVTKMPCWLNHFREQVRLWSEHVSLNTNGRRRNTAMMSWHITIGSDSIANSLRGLLLAVSSKMRKNPVPILTFFLKGVYLSKSIKLLLGSLRKL